MMMMMMSNFCVSNVEIWIRTITNFKERKKNYWKGTIIFIIHTLSFSSLFHIIIYICFWSEKRRRKNFQTEANDYYYLQRERERDFWSCVNAHKHTQTQWQFNQSIDWCIVVVSISVYFFVLFYHYLLLSYSVKSVNDYGCWKNRKKNCCCCWSTYSFECFSLEM